MQNPSEPLDPWLISMQGWGCQSHRGRGKSQGDFWPNGEVVSLNRIDRYVSFLRPVPYGNKIVVKVHTLSPRSYHFEIICKEQRHCFDLIWEVVHEKEKQEWAYDGALRNTTMHWNGFREFPLTRSVQNGMLKSAVRRHYQGWKISYLPKEICDRRSPRPWQI